jgi:hypothetical protein
MVQLDTRVQTLWWVQNLNLRHIYSICFFLEAVFCAWGFKVWKKYKYDPKKNFFEKIQKGIKNAEFHADFKSVEKVLKNSPKKVTSKTSLTNMCKSGKSAYFCHVFADNFVLVHFLKLFQRIWNQRENLRFLIPFLKKKNWYHICTFYQTLNANGQETALKPKHFL